MQARFRLTPVMAALLPLFLLPTAQAERHSTSALAVEADNLHGQMEVQMKADGRVHAERDNEVIEADWLEYFVQRQQIRAGEHVHMTRPDGVIDADNLDYLLQQRTGIADNARFRFHSKDQGKTVKTKGKTLSGAATELEFQGQDQYRLRNVRANTCDPNDDSWYLRAGTLDLDYATSVGVARRMAANHCAAYMAPKV